MSIKCPRCGAEFDVTLFTFDRAVQCDCGAWMDLASGHREDEPEWCVRIEGGKPETEDDEALLAVCRAAYSRIEESMPGNVSAAQLAVAERLRQAGFQLDEHNEQLISGVRTMFAVLADGRSVQRLRSGEWVILRDRLM